MMRIRIRLACVACFCVLFAACSQQKYKGPRRYPLTGKITYNGAPVDAGNISFLPESGDARVSGGIISDGMYSVSEADGANVGPYRVEIRWHKKTGRKFVDMGELVDERKEGLPEKFHAKSDMKVEVTDKATNFNFDLKSP